MLKTEVSYVDLNGKKVTDTLFLHMSRIEMIKFLTRWGVNDPDNVKEEFTIYTLKITNKALAKGIIQSWGISSDLDNIDDCTIQVIVGEKTSVAGTAERLSTRTIPPTSPLLPSRPWPVLN